MVGLERFELSSIAPEATSLDQASRQPLPRVCWLYLDLVVIKISVPEILGGVCWSVPVLRMGLGGRGV